MYFIRIYNIKIAILQSFENENIIKTATTHQISLMDLIVVEIIRKTQSAHNSINSINGFSRAEIFSLLVVRNYKVVNHVQPSNYQESYAAHNSSRVNEFLSLFFQVELSELVYYDSDNKVSKSSNEKTCSPISVLYVILLISYSTELTNLLSDLEITHPSHPLIQTRIKGRYDINYFEDEEPKTIKDIPKEVLNILKENDYVPNSFLGNGSFGWVIAAFNKQHGDVAIKYMGRKEMDVVGKTKKFRGDRVPLEYIILKSTLSNGIIATHDLFITKSFFILILEKHGEFWGGRGCDLKECIKFSMFFKLTR
jgi:hypothetical protein